MEQQRKQQLAEQVIKNIIRTALDDSREIDYQCEIICDDAKLPVGKYYEVKEAVVARLVAALAGRL